MAADYQNGSASSPIDLLQTLASWLVAQGWTQDASASEGSGWRAHLHKGSQYVNFRAAMTGETLFSNHGGSGSCAIGINLGTGYSSGSAWHLQAGAPTEASDVTHPLFCAMNLPAGAIVAYHLFDDGNDNITMVVEKIAGRFVHLGWGKTLKKIGYTFDSWHFYASSPGYWATSTQSGLAGNTAESYAPLSHQPYNSNQFANSFFRVDASVFSARWVGVMGDTSQEVFGYTGAYGQSAVNFDGSTPRRNEHPSFDPFNGIMIQHAFNRALALPIHLFFKSNSTARWAPMGFPLSVFFCEAANNGFTPASIVAVGGINYMVFPHFAVLKAA